MCIWLFQTVLQQLQHKKQDRIAGNMRDIFLMLYQLLDFLDALQCLSLVVINNHIQETSRLQLRRVKGGIFFVGSDSIHHVLLEPECFGKNRNHQ